uniref:Uncharacterized protein n=1 Tax=Arundo donax TaxID=35708 RepID=A0A0A9EVG5_ARUDO
MLISFLTCKGRRQQKMIHIKYVEVEQIDVHFYA